MFLFYLPRYIKQSFILVKIHCLKLNKKIIESTYFQKILQRDELFLLMGLRANITELLVILQKWYKFNVD